MLRAARTQDKIAGNMVDAIAAQGAEKAKARQDETAEKDKQTEFAERARLAACNNAMPGGRSSPLAIPGGGGGRGFGGAGGSGAGSSSGSGRASPDSVSHLESAKSC